MNPNLKENPYFEIPDNQEDINASSYELSNFNDEIVEFPWTFEMLDMGNSERGNPINELVPFFGETIEAGTPLNQVHMGNMDVAIYLLYKWKEWVNQQILSLTLKGDATDGAILNGFIAIQFYTTLRDLDGKVTILDGYYDEVRGELSV